MSICCGGPMKRTLPFVFIITLLIAYCDGTARIRFAETAYDFGALPQKYTAKHMFEFSNTGSGTLHISDIRAD